MKLHQLLYFLETAKHEHVGKAAKILAISPSAISHAISSLEDELGRQLFLKQGKNIHLTNHGKILCERVSRVLNDVEAIKEEIMSDQVELQGTYKIAGSHLLCPSVLAPIWIGIQKENPRLIGEIFTLKSADVFQGVVSGEFDLGLCFSPQSSPYVKFQNLYEGQLVLSVRKQHPLLKMKDPARIRAVSSYPATLPKAHHGIENCQSHPVFDQFGIVPSVDLVFDNYEVAAKKVAMSDGWALLPDWITKRAGLSAIVPEGWSAPVQIAVLWPSNRVLTRVMKQLISALAVELSVSSPSSSPAPARRKVPSAPSARTTH